MKKYLLPALLLTTVMVSAQTDFKCGHALANDYLFTQDKTAKQRFEQLVKTADEQSAGNTQAKLITAITYTIPVVFHILHLGAGENISDAQINDAVAILNRDFRKQNADTANIVSQFKPLAADCQVQFKLATKDENGNCTNGITRHYTTSADWTISQSSYVYTWNPSKYFNIYVVRSMQSGIAGYAYLPGTASTVMDAVVILNGYVGSIGTSNPYTSRALTHETGHWFNLQHTWGSTNQPGVACGDDGVSDTPVTKGHSNCNLTSADCSTGIVENVQNYMEYAYCSNMYTQGQKTRMQNCISSNIANRNNLSSTANLISTGVINPLNNCEPKAEFTSDAITCAGTNFSFTDESYNATVSSWLWSSPSASGTSTLQNGVLNFTSSGIKTVKLKVSNAFGQDSITKQTLIVLGGLNSGVFNVMQGFETAFPDNSWIATTPQYGSGFKKDSTAAATGTSCAWLNNFYDNANGPVSFYSPSYNFQNQSAAPQLYFSYAYAQQATNNTDEFKVYITTDCGTNWNQLYSKSGSTLSTTGSFYTSAYLNPMPNEWQQEIINLSGYTGHPEVSLKFEFTPSASSPGNNFFIDDINVSGTVNVKENKNVFNTVKVYPNPAKDILAIDLENIQLINNETIKIQLLSSVGQLLKEESTATRHAVINIQAFASGIYFLKISSAQGTKVVKVVKE